MTTDKAAKPVFNNQAAIRILNRYINALSTVRDKVRADRHCPAGTAPESIHRIVDETVDSINEIVSALIEAVTALEGYKGVSDDRLGDLYCEAIHDDRYNETRLARLAASMVLAETTAECKRRGIE